MKNYLALILFVLVFCQLNAQGTVKGVVTDKANGELLLGATVIIESSGNGTMTDFDGNYTITNLEPGDYTLVGRFIAYQTLKQNIKISGNETITLDFSLESSVIVIDNEAVVEVRQNRASNTYMENVKKKESSMIDYVSSQEIKRNGDSDASSAIKRVSGVYTIGNFVVVRGLSDRYIKTALNGAEIPSLDPKRNSVSMDLFPTNLIDNLVVVKTLNSNLPSNYSGAYINILTKDYPDNFTFNYSTSIGYNTNSSFNQNFITSEAGATEVFGWDNGFLDIPNSVSNGEILPIQVSNYYDALVYAGYENNLAELDIYSSEDIGFGENQTNIYTLANELEIESVDYIDDVMMTDIREELNQNLSTQTQAFQNNWAPKKTTPILDISHSFSFGDNLKLFGRQFGYNFGFQYKLNSRLYENGRTGRYTLTGIETEKDELEIQRQLSDIRGTRSVYTSALINLAYHLNSTTKLGFTYMPNISGINDARYQNGINPSDAIGLGQEQRQQRYLERGMNVYQLRGEHELWENSGNKIIWTASYTRGKQSTPDLRLFINSYEELEEGALYFDENGNDITDEAVALINDGEVLEEYYPNFSSEEIENGQLAYSIMDNLYPSPTRFYRDMINKTMDLKINYIRPLESLGEKNKLSLGISYVVKTRDYSENRFSFVSNGITYDGNPTNYFNPNNMNIIPGVGLEYLYLRDDTDIQNSYNAFQSVLGGYSMLDLTPTEYLRINTGVRVEATNMLLESAIIEEEALSEELQENYRGSLDIIDVLPSLNLTYTLLEKELQTLNLRFSASQSVARPLFREKAPFSVFDFEIQEQQTGNTDLNRTKILNIDNRLEFFPYLGEIISITGFYKGFTDPIEQVIISTSSNTEITWKNVERAQLYGAELEVKKNLGFINDKLDNLNIAFNATYIKSKTSIASDELIEIRATDPDHEDTRPMFGQSPYIINCMISYVNSEKGLSINSGFNISGEKLVLVTPGGTPDVYDQPRGTLDMSINKTIGDKLSISLKGRNLLDPEYKQTYTFKDIEYDFQSFNIGRTFTIGLSYNFSKEEN